jgi:ribonuclease HI
LVTLFVFAVVFVVVQMSQGWIPPTRSVGGIRSKPLVTRLLYGADRPWITQFVDLPSTTNTQTKTKTKTKAEKQPGMQHEKEKKQQQQHEKEKKDAFWIAEQERISGSKPDQKSEVKKKPTYGNKMEESKAAEEWIFHRLLTPASCRLVFTDGSCRPNPGYGGAAALLIDARPITVDPSTFPSVDEMDGDQQLLRNQMIAEMELFESTQKLMPLGYTTNNICELTAVDLGLQLAEQECKHRPKNAPTPSTYWIVTDSNYSIGVLGGSTQAHKNKELIHQITAHIEEIETTYGIKIKFRWVPGHANVRYNEQVDSLSKKAAHEAYSHSSAKAT